MKKNKSLNLQITLPPKPGEMIVYSFAGTGPIVDHDPVLNLNPPSFDIFLEYMGLSEEEFNKIVLGLAIPPYDHDFDAKGDAPRVWDFDQWYREDNRKK